MFDEFFIMLNNSILNSTSAFWTLFFLLSLVFMEFFFILNIVENRKPKKKQDNDFPFLKQGKMNDFKFVILSKFAYLLVGIFCSAFLLSGLIIIGLIIYLINYSVMKYILIVAGVILVNYIIYKVTKRK